MRTPYQLASELVRYVEDASGHQHAPAGRPEGGQFTKSASELAASLSSGKPLTPHKPEATSLHKSPQSQFIEGELGNKRTPSFGHFEKLLQNQRLKFHPRDVAEILFQTGAVGFDPSENFIEVKSQARLHDIVTAAATGLHNGRSVDDISKLSYSEDKLETTGDDTTQHAAHPHELAASLYAAKQRYDDDNPVKTGLNAAAGAFGHAAGTAAGAALFA